MNPSLEKLCVAVSYSASEPTDWRRQQQAVAEDLLASVQDLAADLEWPTVDQFMRLALAEMPHRRYVSVIAHYVNSKPPTGPAAFTPDRKPRCPSRPARRPR